MISIKSDREIELMRQAGKYLVDTFKYIEKYNVVNIVLVWQKE